jgi:polyisoprenoid-binding protein YceI
MPSRLIKIAAALVALAVVGVVALVVVTMIRSDDPNLRTEAPQIPTATPGSSSASTTGIATPSAASATLPAGVLHFVIQQTGSEVKYVVRETLRGVVGANAVGTTSAITGDLYLTTQGLASGLPSKFSVDLRQLRTDESMRDNYVRQNVLQTSRYPMAEFVAESLTGFPASYVEGQEASMTLSGTLTIHGVSKKADWTVKARRAGDTLTGIADIRFNMSEYGIRPPSVPVAQAEDGVQLQVTITAKLASGG